MTRKGIVGKQSVPALLALLLAAGAIFCLTSCATVPSRNVRAERLVMAQQIAAEPAGDYFIGRRYFKSNYRFWGYIRRPQQPWSSAVLVMLNENKKLAPDRAQLGKPGSGESYETHAGFDNNYEYKLTGYFSGDKVYELVSNSIYPEFVLTDYELRSKNPPPIFPSQINHTRVSPYVVEKPE
jgi:hypothetical protein